MPDHYEIIGVPRNASLAEIRIAYRRSAQILHPDRFETASDAVRQEAQRRMRQLNAAMESIEAERGQDEVSGTGRLGAVALGRAVREPLAAAPEAERPAPDAVAPAATATAPPAPAAPLPSPLRPLAPVTAGPVDALEIPLPDLSETAAPVAPAAPPPAHPDGDDDFEFESARQFEHPASRSRTRARTRPGRGMLLVGLAIAAALAAFTAYVTLGGDDGGAEAVFSDPEAPFTFSYPQGFTNRTASLGAGVARNRPSFQVALGPRPRNLTLAAAYDLTFSVADDGTATGPGGEQITADELNENVDVAMNQIADAAGMQAVGAVQLGSLGPLPARIYEFAKAGNELRSTFVVAFAGKEQFFVSCQRTPEAAAEIEEACALLQETFEPVS